MDKETESKLTAREIRFFRAQGLAFRQLWAKRMKAGLKREQRKRLEWAMNKWEHEQKEQRK